MNLTVRELECLGFIAEGFSNKAIGRELWLSEFTVKTHVGRLFRKLGARDRAHAVGIAYRTGLLELGPLTYLGGAA